MKTVELWVPLYWADAIMNNDLTALTEDEQYAFYNFMDCRYLHHGTFTPVGIDMNSVDKMVVHDAMAAVKEHPIECVKITFSVDSYWRRSANG